jgi:hypothetical protein
MEALIMNLTEEVLKIVLGLTITACFTAFHHLFRWIDKTDLRLHDLDRDFAHLKRQNLDLSNTVANLDIKDERMITGFRRTIYSISGRISRVETRVYVVENRLSDSLTQAIDRTKDTPLDSRKISP